MQMKFFGSQVIKFLQDRPSRFNLLAILRFVGMLAALVIVYSLIFQVLMEYEGRPHSFITGIYWTLTVMSTLGFGDITFQSDIGKLFSTVVLISGILLLLILLPFTFIEFFYEPWIKAQRAARAPTELPEKTRGHVIIVGFNAVTESLIEKLNHYRYPHVLLVPDLTGALRLHDLEYNIMLGDLDSPKSYELARVNQAILVVTTASDQLNANVAATVREVSETVPIIATANTEASVDILELAGCSSVLQLGEMMGQALGRRVSQGATLAQTIGHVDGLYIAEATVRDTSLVGRTLRESCLRETTGVNVLGIWRRGEFQLAEPDMTITRNAVLVMAGSEEQIAKYNAQFRAPVTPGVPVVIIGGGRVGKATAKALAARGLHYRIIEKNPERIRDKDKYVLGDAAELEVLEAAGIHDTPTVIVTTHDDDMNIYLTIYCRRLRPDVQIISRAVLERNIATLHRSGADMTMSYASAGANAIINLMGRENILMIAEGLDVFEVEIPDSLAGKSVAESGIRRKTGCTVIASRKHGTLDYTIEPHEPLPPDSRIILVGTPEAEERFLRLYKEKL